MTDKRTIHAAILAVEETLPLEKRHAWETHAGKVAFKLFRADLHLRELRFGYSAAALDHGNVMPASARLEDVSSAYMGPHAEPLFCHLDAFFEAAKSCQDFCLTCLATAGLLQSPPNSLHRYVVSRATRSADVVDHLLRAAWVQAGAATKEYRDCFSHYVALAGLTWQHAIIMRWRTDRWTTHLYLPDNPSARSYEKFTYDKRIDALDLSESLFSASRDLVSSVLSQCVLSHRADPTRHLNDFSLTLRNVVVGR